MTSPIQRFRGFPPGRRRLLELELLAVAILVVVALLVRRGQGVEEVIGMAALGYAVGLTTHVGFVVFGWAPRQRRDRGPDVR